MAKITVDNIKERMEKGYPTLIEIQNWQDPGDGSISISAIVKDGYTKEPLFELNWYYSLEALLRDLDELLQ